MSEISKDHIEEFVRQARRVGDHGLTICSSGNLSWRIGEKVLLSGTGSWVPELTPDRVAVVNLEDGVSLNGVRPTMESSFHLGVLRERPDVNVVLHFQSPYATCLACRKTLPADLNFTAEVPLHVGDTIPVVPFLRPGSKELAEAVVAAMKVHNSILMKKHGQVTCGKDFNQAIERAMFFEMAARIAIFNGDNIDPLTSEEVLSLEEYFLGKKH